MESISDAVLKYGFDDGNEPGAFTSIILEEWTELNCYFTLEEYIYRHNLNDPDSPLKKAIAPTIIKLKKQVHAKKIICEDVITKIEKLISSKKMGKKLYIQSLVRELKMCLDWEKHLETFFKDSFKNLFYYIPDMALDAYNNQCSPEDRKSNDCFYEFFESHFKQINQLPNYENCYIRFNIFKHITEDRFGIQFYHNGVCTTTMIEHKEGEPLGDNLFDHFEI